MHGRISRVIFLIWICSVLEQQFDVIRFNVDPSSKLSITYKYKY
jgi:hypothetical protein